MRAFIAIEIDESIRQALSVLISELRVGHSEWKWVEPRNIHLTLKFLGAVADPRVPEVVGIMRSCAKGLGPFEMRVEGTGAFPNPNRPRVVFARAAATPPHAAELARRLNDGMASLGVEREDRPFQSHLTLARLREPRPIPDVARKLESLADHCFGAMTVRQITLFKSDLRPTGPIYTPVERVALTG